MSTLSSRRSLFCRGHRGAYGVSLLLLACGSDHTLLLEAGADPASGVGAAGAAAGPPPLFSRLGLPAKLELTTEWRVAEAFSGVSFDDPVSLIEAPNTGHLFVSEREGKLFAFERRADVTEKHLVLDLSGQNQGENDSGLLGVAFHPEFGLPESDNRGYVYVHYAYLVPPIVGRTPPFSTPTQSRLSRFEVDLDTLVADPASELVLINQRDQNVWHQGGALFFHPEDGFLYISVGDEGGASCQYDNCQRIDKDLFSGVLRIDVDRRGGEVSHPIPRQPASGSTAGYFIPNDNPFVGQPGVLEEFYALGLRNAHRMTHDPVDNLIWMGEVGQEGREELNILARGANYQWNAYEGTERSTGALPDVPLGVWTDPVLELTRQEARSVIGGYVYRGQRLPELQGKYIFADFSGGRIWALPYALAGGQVELGELELLMSAELRDRENGITSFGVDAAGELYILTLGSSSKILRLESAATSLNAPQRLSETGVFSDLPAREPMRGLLGYSVQSPLWSDGADKRRWLALPEAESVRFAASGSWEFPEGTVFIKHFDMAFDEREPSRLTPLETRLLVAGAGGEYYGMTYRWTADGSDAELVTDGLFETLQVTDANGNLRAQTYFYPGPSDCATCHSQAAGHVLGVRTAQLNGPGDVASGGSDNQLLQWLEWGVFDNAPERAALDGYPRLAPLTDSTRSLQDRVRSYWDSNCSMCHGVQASIRAEWDARYETPLEQQHVVSAGSLNGGRDGALYLIEPGSPAQSILYQRNSTLTSGLRMPPVGTHRIDEPYLEQLDLWIRSLGGAPAPAERMP